MTGRRYFGLATIPALALLLIAGCNGDKTAGNGTATGNSPAETAVGSKDDAPPTSHTDANKEKTASKDSGKELIESRQALVTGKSPVTASGDPVQAVLNRAKSVKLSETQKRRLQEIQKKYEPQIQALAQKVEAVRESTQKLAEQSNKGENVSLEQVRANLSAAQPTMERLQAIQEKMMNDARSVLTPDQRERLRME